MTKKDEQYTHKCTNVVNVGKMNTESPVHCAEQNSSRRTPLAKRLFQYFIYLISPTPIPNTLNAIWQLKISN